MKLDKSIAKQIFTIISEILKDNSEIILFGSYATDKATKSSDIDIAINSGTPLSTTKWSLIEEQLEESEITLKVDVVDYHRVKDPFKKIIDKDGMKLQDCF